MMFLEALLPTVLLSCELGHGAISVSFGQGPFMHEATCLKSKGGGGRDRSEDPSDLTEKVLTRFAANLDLQLLIILGFCFRLAN
jgi:hypothetical protein